MQQRNAQLSYDLYETEKNTDDTEVQTQSDCLSEGKNIACKILSLRQKSWLWRVQESEREKKICTSGKQLVCDSEWDLAADRHNGT